MGVREFHHWLEVTANRQVNPVESWKGREGEPAAPEYLAQRKQELGSR